MRMRLPDYEFQEYTYYGNWDDKFFMEGYRSRLHGAPVDCFIVAHMNDGRNWDERQSPAMASGASRWPA
ncbi:hypothetical protein QO004_006252 [Rhizobium mesoamericanum]|nr:hypothetical protein [Rhizobium mesoamericanum]